MPLLVVARDVRDWLRELTTPAVEAAALDVLAVNAIKLSSGVSIKLSDARRVSTGPSARVDVEEHGVETTPKSWAEIEESGVERTPTSSTARVPVENARVGPRDINKLPLVIVLLLLVFVALRPNGCADEPEMERMKSSSTMGLTNGFGVLGDFAFDFLILDDDDDAGAAMSPEAVALPIGVRALGNEIDALLIDDAVDA